MKAFAVSIAILAFTITSARAMSDEHMAAASHIGQVIAGAKICKKVEMVTTNMALVTVGLGVDLEDPLFAELVQDKVEETVEAWRGRDEDVACLAVMFLYGPDGQNVPGLLRWK